jgi:hypothetical protein
MRTYFILAALLIAAPVAADTPASVQKTLQTDYNQRDSAFGRRDINATLLHYAPEFVGISSTGKLHDLKEERLDFLHTFALPIRSSVTKSTVERLTLARAGTEATLTVRRHGILILVSQTKGSDVLTLDGVFQDVWAKRPTGWLLTREQAQSVTAAMNGKPI